MHCKIGSLNLFAIYGNWRTKCLILKCALDRTFSDAMTVYRCIEIFKHSNFAAIIHVIHPSTHPCMQHSKSRSFAGICLICSAWNTAPIAIYRLPLLYDIGHCTWTWSIYYAVIAALRYGEKVQNKAKTKPTERMMSAEQHFPDWQLDDGVYFMLLLCCFKQKVNELSTLNGR